MLMESDWFDWVNREESNENSDRLIFASAGLLKLSRKFIRNFIRFQFLMSPLSQNLWRDRPESLRLRLRETVYDCWIVAHTKFVTQMDALPCQKNVGDRFHAIEAKNDGDREDVAEQRQTEQNWANEDAEQSKEELA